MMCNEVLNPGECSLSHFGFFPALSNPVVLGLGFSEILKDGSRFWVSAVHCVPVAKDWDRESDFTPVCHCCFSGLLTRFELAVQCN